MIPQDQLLFLTGMIMTTISSFFLRYIPTYSLKIAYSLTLSICLQFYTYGVPTLLPLSLHVVMYYLMTNFKRQRCGLYTITTSMLLVSIYFIYVMVVDFGRFQLDVSTILMMSICKYSLIAFSYQDGLSNDNQLSQQRQKQKLIVLPSFFEFFNYMVFLPTCLINTSFSYSLFISYMKKQKQFVDVPFNKILKKLGKEIFFMAICSAIYLTGLAYFPVTAMSKQEYISRGLINHLWYGYVSTHFYKYRFYSGFILMQLPVHASGLSYIPQKGDQFEGIKTIDIYKNETAYHIRDKLGSWNMAVQQWLRKCVYERLPYSKPKNQFITLMFSALWHGFYPGVFATFALWSLQLYLGNTIYKFSRLFEKHWLVKLYNKAQRYLFYFCWFIWDWIIINNSVYFLVLTVQNTYGILSMMKFFNPILLLLAIVFFNLIWPKQNKKDKQT